MLCVNCGSMDEPDGYQCMDCAQVYCDKCCGNFLKRAFFGQIGYEAKECPRCGSRKKMIYLQDQPKFVYDGEKMIDLIYINDEVKVTRAVLQSFEVQGQEKKRAIFP